MASYGFVVGGNRRVTAGHRSAISRPFRAVIGYLTCPPDDCIVGNSVDCRPCGRMLTPEKKKIGKKRVFIESKKNWARCVGFTVVLPTKHQTLRQCLSKIGEVVIQPGA